MNNPTLLALAKLLEHEAKTKRPKVRAGDYALDQDILLHVEGTLHVGDDHEYTPTTSIPWKTTLALFVRYAGITREHALRGLVQAMQAALAAESDESAEELIEALADLDEAESEVQASLSELPKQNRKGAVVAKDVAVTEVKSKKKAA
jgi:hypothetical protein